MKTRLISRVALAMLLFLSVSSFAQSNPVISYQGTLEQNGSLAPDGIYQITVTLYANLLGKDSIWSDTYSAEVHNGIFNVLLGSKDKLPDSKTLDRQLWLGIKVGAGQELRPLTKLGVSLIAFNVPDKSISMAKLSDEVIQSLTKSGTETPQTIGDGVKLGGNPFTDNIDGAEWIGSKSLAADANSTGSKQVWIKTNSVVAMRYIPSGVFTPNIIGGFSGNLITGTGAGSVIGGGGATGAINGTESGFTVIGGGSDNYIESSAAHSVIVGGSINRMIDDFSFIGGGQGHQLGGVFSSIVGGDDNTINSEYSFLGGGNANYIHLGADYSVIGGGLSNVIHGFGAYSVIAGGDQNYIEAASCIIGGGLSNHIEVDAELSFIGGGAGNLIERNSSVIGGGSGNRIHPVSSLPASSDVCVIVGGGQNEILTDALGAFIGGGTFNVIQANGDFGSILGGTNLVSQSAYQTVIGHHNLAQGTSTTGSVVGNDRLFIIGNGSPITPSNAFEVSNNGHSIVYHDNTSTGAAIHGATYKDNVIYGWGVVTGAGVLTNGFGVNAAITHTIGTGVYIINLNTIKPDGTAGAITSGAVVATLQDGDCYTHIRATPVAAGIFTVTIVNGLTTPEPCSGEDHGFMFHVTGRP